MRLIAYMKPYAHWVIFALLLVLGLTAFDLYRPMLVGDAIDTFGANGDYDVIIATAIKYAVVLALSFASVSYTHLDVYKRQGKSCLRYPYVLCAGCTVCMFYNHGFPHRAEMVWRVENCPEKR